MKRALVMRAMKFTKIPLRITFRGVPQSEAIEIHIRENASKLDPFCERIISCRVFVEAPNRRHRKTKPYRVRIDIAVPGAEIVINRGPRPSKAPLNGRPEISAVDWTETHDTAKHGAEENVYAAIHDAFDAARRKLENYSRRRRGSVKAHEADTHARVSRLFQEEGFGFLKTFDGREIYFHRNNVLEGGFSHLRVGTAVYFCEEHGEKGPQAGTVKLAGNSGFAGVTGRNP